MAHPRGILAQAALMADELEGQRLVVKKVDSDRGKVRVVEEENPEWYQRFCAKYTSARKDSYRWKTHKTSIKRREALLALRQIATGGRKTHPNQYTESGGYVTLLMPFIVRALKERRELDAAIARDIRRQSKVPF